MTTHVHVFIKPRSKVFNGSYWTDSSVANDQSLDVNFSELLSRSNQYKFCITVIYFKLVFNRPTSDGATQRSIASSASLWEAVVPGLNDKYNWVSNA